MPTTDRDFILFDHGSICILHPRSDAAIDWIDEHIDEQATRWGQHGVVIEPRYVADILDGINCDGLTVA